MVKRLTSSGSIRTVVRIGMGCVAARSETIPVMTEPVKHAVPQRVFEALADSAGEPASKVVTAVMPRERRPGCKPHGSDEANGHTADKRFRRMIYGHGGEPHHSSRRYRG